MDEWGATLFDEITLPERPLRGLVTDGSPEGKGLGGPDGDKLASIPKTSFLKWCDQDCVDFRINPNREVNA